jgi:hypothetical protein
MLKRDRRNSGGRMSAAALGKDQPIDCQTNQSEIAELAYRLWVDRGCPSGSPEEDWFEAERRLSSRGLVQRHTA